MTMYNDALMGQRVRLLIRAKYGSAKACSRATGITEQTIGKMQKVDTHKGSMHLDTIARVADSLGTSIDYLVGRINKDPEKAQYTPYNQDEIAERAFYARCHNKLTVSTVADHAGLMHCVVNNIEYRRNTGCNLYTLDKLADCYGTSLDWLTGRIEDRKRDKNA